MRNRISYLLRHSDSEISAWRRISRSSGTPISAPCGFGIRTVNVYDADSQFLGSPAFIERVRHGV